MESAVTSFSICSFVSVEFRFSSEMYGGCDGQVLTDSQCSEFRRMAAPQLRPSFPRP